jgi:predicted acetyltransferase
VEDAEYLERRAIRHQLTDLLRDSGGHIGYDVRPTARRRGYVTAMLGEALPLARALGLDQVLVSCDSDSVASRKVIEANGGRYKDHPVAARSATGSGPARGRQPVDRCQGRS